MELKKIDHVKQLNHIGTYLCKLGRWWALLHWDNTDGRFWYEEDEYYYFGDCREVYELP